MNHRRLWGYTDIEQAFAEKKGELMGESNFYATMGANIKTYRKLQHMTQQELANKIRKSMACISKYEKGEIAIDLYTLYEIAEALGIPPSLLFPQDSGNAPESAPSTADLPSLFWHSPLYLYTLGVRRFEAVCSVIEIDSQNMKATAYYAPSDPHNYQRSSLYIMLGSIYSSESNVRLYFSNPLLKGDFMLLCFRTSDLIAGNCQGAFIALNTNHRFCSSKCYLSSTPIQDLDALKEQLAIEKDEMYFLKKNSILFL